MVWYHVGFSNVGSTLHGLVTQLIGGAQAVTVKGQDVQQHDVIHSQNHAVPHPELDLCNLWKVATGWAGKPKKETMTLRKDTSDYCLTSYSAWWRRIEKDERKFHKEVK